MVAGVGLEPTTSWLWATRAATAPSRDNPFTITDERMICNSFNWQSIYNQYKYKYKNKTKKVKMSQYQINGLDYEFSIADDKFDGIDAVIKQS